MEFTQETFGTLYADGYDAAHDPGTTDDSVAMISELAGPKARILELAIGTGRVALPLAARGHRIDGIEGSADMVVRLRAKPGGAAIPVSICDMADVAVDGTYDHVFLVFNTIFNLTSQAAQVRLFRNVAARLAPGGTFLVETFVPDLSGFTGHQRMATKSMDLDRLKFEAILHDPLEQTFRYQRVTIDGTGTRLSPLVMRYARPPELDLMAQLAGLRLRSRWGGWQKQPFTAESTMHISVWERPAAT